MYLLILNEDVLKDLVFLRYKEFLYMKNKKISVIFFDFDGTIADTMKKAIEPACNKK